MGDETGGGNKARVYWIGGTIGVLILCCCLVLAAGGIAALVLSAQPGGLQALFGPRTPVEIRWFVGLGSGTDSNQVEIEQAVVDAFNASHPSIRLILDVTPYEPAAETLAAQFAAGNGPDIVGPFGFYSAHPFEDQWLDLTPYIESSGFDLSQYNPALVSMYRTEAGLLAIPFSVYPAATFYNPILFDEAGLEYPPADYGQDYRMLDGRTVEWSWDTLAEIARWMTIDINGNNATAPDFDRDRIVQYGYSPVWESHPNYIGSFWGPGLIYAGEPGAYGVEIPEAWKAAWQWYYDGMWGDQPFIASGPAAWSPAFGSGNTFASGKIAMTVNMSWYTCCLGDMVAAGFDFDLAALPSYQGQVYGRVDADTFRIWRGSAHPRQAFEVLAYLVGPMGVEPLIAGEAGPPAFEAIPSLEEFQYRYLDARRNRYPLVENWDVLLAGLNYPDVPSAEAYAPNFSEAWARIQVFGDLLANAPDLDLEAEIALLEADLTQILNR